MRIDCGRLKRLLTGLALAGLIGLAGNIEGPTAHAEELPAVAGPEQTTLQVAVYKSRVVQLDVPVKKVSVGNQEIADILILGPSQVYVVGKTIGTTNVLLWDAANRPVRTIDVEVTPDLDGLKTRLHELLPEEKIEVRASQGTIVLSGEVSNVERMDAAVKLARSFARAGAGGKEKKEGDKDGGEVLNLMQVGGAHQVMLEVKVAEVSRTLMRKFGVNLSTLHRGDHWQSGVVNGGATFPPALDAAGLKHPVFGVLGDGKTPIGPAVTEFLPNTATIGDTGIFASYLADGFLMNVAIEANKANGLARILAEPTLTSLSGQEAQFLSGGEFPIPVPRGLNGVTIEFKEFGVGLKFLPVVLDSGKVSLKLNISVSELTSPNSVVLTSPDTTSSFLIPALTKRSAQSTVELGDGQTIGIAGLINENMRETINKFPGLGDIPVLGALFRSQDFQKGQTELVILVTPRLAKPLARAKTRLPTDGFVYPSDADFYLMGRLEGHKKDAAPKDGGTPTPATSVPSAPGEVVPVEPLPPTEPRTETPAPPSSGKEQESQQDSDAPSSAPPTPEASTARIEPLPPTVPPTPGPAAGPNPAIEGDYGHQLR